MTTAVELKKEFKELSRTLKTNRLLFYIQRSTDDQIIVYEALRKGDKLVAPYVANYWSKENSPEFKEDIDKTLKDLFFGIDIVPDGKRYKMKIKACPTQLSLRLNTNGTVLAKSIMDMNINGEIKQVECRIFKIYMDCEYYMNMPCPTSITVYGTHKTSVVCKKFPVNQQTRESYCKRYLARKITNVTTNIWTS